MSTPPSIYVVFNPVPGTPNETFVEIEDVDGRSISVGEWIPDYGNGFSALRIPYNNGGIVAHNSLRRKLNDHLGYNYVPTTSADIIQATITYQRQLLSQALAALGGPVVDIRPVQETVADTLKDSIVTTDEDIEKALGLEPVAVESGVNTEARTSDVAPLDGGEYPVSPVMDTALGE